LSSKDSSYNIEYISQTKYKMPLKSTLAQLKAARNYYTKNTESIKIRKALYHLAHCEEIKQKQKEYYNKKKNVLQVPIVV
jgi:hypothetical protein